MMTAQAAIAIKSTATGGVRAYTAARSPGTPPPPMGNGSVVCVLAVMTTIVGGVAGDT